MLKRLLLSIVGIYAAYLSISIIAEQLYKHPYSPARPGLPTAYFTHPPLVSCFGALLCAIGGRATSLLKKDPPNPIPVSEQLVLSTLYTANILTTSYSLLYISLPVQVIGRNIRFLLVVVIGAYFSRVSKKHTDLRVGKHKLLNALIITGGVLLFNLSKPLKDSAEKANIGNQWVGYALLLTSVLCDALFSDSQAYCKATFQPNATQLFTTINLWAFFFTWLVAAFKGTVCQSLLFVWNYPSCMMHIALSGGLQIIGQVCIYQVIANFKQHVFPLISTTRKVITVVLSIFIFGHDIAPLQWLAMLIVFSGMIYELTEEVAGKEEEDQTGRPHQE